MSPCIARGIPIPWPGIKLVPPAVEAHWVLAARLPGKSPFLGFILGVF